MQRGRRLTKCARERRSCCRVRPAQLAPAQSAPATAGAGRAGLRLRRLAEAAAVTDLDVVVVRQRFLLALELAEAWRLRALAADRLQLLSIRDGLSGRRARIA